MHYLALVFVEKSKLLAGDTPEQAASFQLERYSETNEQAITLTRADLIDAQKKYVEQVERTIYQQYLDDPDGYKESVTPKSYVFISEEFPDMLKMSDDELYRERLKWYDGSEITEDGEVEVFYNPEGKWDWHVLGGRWDGALKLEDSRGVNVATVKDVQFSFDMDAYLSNLRKWELVVEGQPPRNSKERSFIDKIDVTGIRRLMENTANDKETFGRLQSEFMPEVFVTSDGEWHEKSDDAEYYKEWEKARKRYANDYIVAIDCHV